MTSPTILVVEDEPIIRMFAADIAIEAGFHVVEATDAEAAIALLETDPTIGVVFTDIHMPGHLDGLAMSHVARDRWPPLQFLIVSGHRQPKADELPRESRFIPKPYVSSEITEALRALAKEWSSSVSDESLRLNR